MIGRFAYCPVPTRIVFGVGAAVAELPRELDANAMTKFAVLCSPSGAAFAQLISAELPGRCVAIIDRADSSLGRDQFDRLVEEVKQAEVDGFVVVGGGTPIGVAKAIAARLEIPYIAIVTSYSGSEMSPKWTSGAGTQRLSGSHASALPVTAIYDPQLTLSLPPAVSVASGMNAMAHAVESLYAPDLSPVVETQASIAIAKLAEALPVIVREPGNIEARSQALYAAWLAAAFRAEAGIEHVLAQQVRQAFSLDHARTHAVFLPYAVAYNRVAAPRAVAKVGEAVRVADAANGLYDLNVRLGLATGLKDLGMRAADIERAVDVVANAKFVNPRQVGRAGILDVVTQAFHGGPPRF